MNKKELGLKISYDLMNAMEKLEAWRKCEDTPAEWNARLALACLALAVAGEYIAQDSTGLFGGDN